jgi:hypothetical protein
VVPSGSTALCLFAAALLAGCSASELPVPTPGATYSENPRLSSLRRAESAVPSPSPEPTPADTPGPSAPAFARRPDFRAQRDGLALELWLPDRVVQTGGRIFAHVRVTNGSNRTVYRQVGGNCGDVSRIIVDQRALMPEGRTWSGIAATFKQRVLEERGYGLSGFQNVTRIGHPGCPDFSLLHPVNPGAVLDETRAWDIVGAVGRPVVPGSTKLTATFTYYRDRNHAEPSDERKLNIVTEIRVDGEPTGETWITEYVDRALAQPRFADWLDNRPVTSWINTDVVDWPNDDGEYPARPPYDRATQGAIDIGLFRWDEELGEFGGVTLDLPSGELLGFRFEECC